MGVLALVLTTTAFKHIRQQQQSHIVLYHTPRHTLLDCVSGQSAISFNDLLITEKQTWYATANYRAFRGIRQVTTYPIHRDSSREENHLKWHPPLLQFQQCRLALLDALPDSKPIAPIPVDYLLLYDNATVAVDQLADYFSFDTLLIGTSNHPRQVDSWVDACEKAGLPYRSVAEEGAIIIYPLIK